MAPPGTREVGALIFASAGPAGPPGEAAAAKQSLFVAVGVGAFIY